MKHCILCYENHKSSILIGIFEHNLPEFVEVDLLGKIIGGRVEQVTSITLASSIAPLIGHGDGGRELGVLSGPGM